MTREVVYDWKRFWCPRGSSINLIDGGYLADPDVPYGSNVNPALRPFEEVAELPCLALLGEPGNGKTETMKAERAAIDAAVTAEGAGRFGWICAPAAASNGLRPSSSAVRSSPPGWTATTVFTFSSTASMSAYFGSIPSRPCSSTSSETIPLSAFTCVSEAEPRSGRTSWRRVCKICGPMEAYELAPLRRVDVAAAASAKELDAETFLRAVDEAEAVPLAIKPVTMDFLIDSYRAWQSTMTACSRPSML